MKLLEITDSLVNKRSRSKILDLQTLKVRKKMKKSKQREENVVNERKKSRKPEE